jgi:hypothetical protein
MEELRGIKEAMQQESQKPSETLARSRTASEAEANLNPSGSFKTGEL